MLFVVLYVSVGVCCACVGAYSRWTDIVKYYVRSMKFVTDVFSIIPLELFCLLLETVDNRQKAFGFLKFNRLLKFYRVSITLFTPTHCPPCLRSSVLMSLMWLVVGRTPAAVLRLCFSRRVFSYSSALFSSPLLIKSV